MKRLFNTIIILIILYVCYQAAVKFFGPGHDIKYMVKTGNDKFSVHEVFDNETNNYFISVYTDNRIFKFQTFEDFTKSDVIVKDIHYFNSGENACMLPIFIDKRIIMDMICLNDVGMNFYHNMQGVDSKVDAYVEKFDLSGYTVDQFIDLSEPDFEIGTLNINTNNRINNHFVWIENKNGINTINDFGLKPVYDINLFKNATSGSRLSETAGNYYVTADYNNLNYFKKFYLVNIISNEEFEVNYNKEISFNSYIQGTFDGSIYLIDRESKRQIQINSRTKKAIEIGNTQTGMMLLSGDKLERKEDPILFESDVYFEKTITSDDSDYIRLGVTESQKYGYTYYYKKISNDYKIYRKINGEDDYIYLFRTDKIYNMIFEGNYVYYYNVDSIKYYSDETGVKTLTTNSGIEFTENIKFGLYIK